MDERRQWVEHDHLFLSVRQQAAILGLQRSGIYYKPRQESLSEGQLESVHQTVSPRESFQA